MRYRPIMKGLNDECKKRVVLDSLFLKNNVDIYITGSNAQMLSGEISSLLSGRYVEIEMLPLLKNMLTLEQIKAI